MDLRRSNRSVLALGFLAIAPAIALLASTGCGSSDGSGSLFGLPFGTATLDQVTRGRAIVTDCGCSDCHNRGKDDPSDANWLAGYIPPNPAGAFEFGPVTTYASNITPNVANGIGGFTDRQIYNALKYGLDPEDTPDVVISGTTPGAGNFPAAPHYLAAPMPWIAFRHMPDGDLWSIVAYIKHGIKANSNSVPESGDLTGDNWASFYASAKVGPYPLPLYPAASEQFIP
jgi:hypothetical protein